MIRMKGDLDAVYIVRTMLVRDKSQNAHLLGPLWEPQMYGDDISVLHVEPVTIQKHTTYKQ